MNEIFISVLEWGTYEDCFSYFSRIFMEHVGQVVSLCLLHEFR